MSLDLKGKVAVVTGGLSGIGFEIVKFLLDNQVKGVTIIDKTLVEKVIRELEVTYERSRVLFCEADVSKKDEFEDAFERTVERFKNVDVLINNAGIADDSKWETIIPVNLNGVINGTLLAIDHYISKYKSSDSGLIINVSSVAALTPLETFPVYSSTKSAVMQFTRALGSDFHFDRTKIRIVAICPGPTETPLLAGLKQGCLKKEFAEYLDKENADKFIPQKAEDVAKSLRKVIGEARSGSVWVAEGGEVYEIEMPSYKQLKV